MPTQPASGSPTLDPTLTPDPGPTGWRGGGGVLGNPRVGVQKTLGTPPPNKTLWSLGYVATLQTTQETR